MQRHEILSLAQSLTQVALQMAGEYREAPLIGADRAEKAKQILALAKRRHDHDARRERGCRGPRPSGEEASRQAARPSLRAGGDRRGAAGRLPLAAVALASVALVFAGCGGETNPDAPQEAAAGLFGGVPLRRATCSEWNDATVRDRLGVLGDLKALRGDQITGPGVRGYGSVLDDDLAYNLFQSRCNIPNSESFLLYKLYGFAAGFAGGPPE